MAAIPLSWNDPMFDGVTSSNAVNAEKWGDNFEQEYHR